ncbi:MAG: universal stress protein [Candidatus Tectomicrobia bacterium]|nr:universal stress protein [Candidatus Tectomicrobia bacterium]
MNGKKILVPIDFSEYSQEVLNYALRLLENDQVEMILLHVLPKAVEVSTAVDVPPEKQSLSTRGSNIGVDVAGGPVGYYYDREMKGINREIVEEARKKLSDLVPQTQQDQVKIEVRVGQPYQEILNAAKEKQVDTIVMGTHGRTGLSHLLLGSVAEHVVRESSVPVTIVKKLVK